MLLDVGIGTWRHMRIGHILLPYFRLNLAVHKTYGVLATSTCRLPMTDIQTRGTVTRIKVDVTRPWVTTGRKGAASYQSKTIYCTLASIVGSVLLEDM